MLADARGMRDVLPVCTLKELQVGLLPFVSLLAHLLPWLEARGCQHVCLSVCLRCQLAQDELDDRSIVSQLKSAIQTGSLSGGVGQLNLGDVDVENLEAAVRYAQHIGSKTRTSNQMLATAQLVLSLRKSFLSNDVASARDLLEAVKGRVIAAVAAEEVQAAKAEVDNWAVVSQLSAAIANGRAQVRRFW